MNLNMMTNLTKKQQVLLAATLVIFVLVIWQLFSLLGASKPKSAQEIQKEYSQLTAEYQLVQLKRQIAEGQAAIAQARLAAAKANTELNKYPQNIVKSTEIAKPVEIKKPAPVAVVKPVEVKKTAPTAVVKPVEVKLKEIKVEPSKVVLAASPKPHAAPVLPVMTKTEVPPAKKPVPVAVVKPVEVKLKEIKVEPSKVVLAASPKPHATPVLPVITKADLQQAQPKAVVFSPAPNKIAPTPAAPAVAAKLPEAAPHKITETDLKQLQALLSSQQQLDNKKEQKKEEIKAAAVAAVPANNSAFLDADPKSYTLQLIANSEPGSLKKFIKTHQLEGKARWYRTVRDGKPWYVLIYGHYANMAEAKRALEDLPEEMMVWTPFIKSFASVQSAIKQAQ